MFCPYCGKEVSEAAAFCPYCGNRIPANTVPYQGGAETQPSGAGSASAPAWSTVPDRTSNKNRALFIVLAVLAGVLLAAGTIYAVYYFGNARSARTVQQQFEKAETVYDTIIQDSQPQDSQDTISENSAMPLSAKDLTWSLEPTLEYDDIEPIWARDFSDNIPAEEPIYSDGKAYLAGTSIAEMCYQQYSPLSQYYLVKNGSGWRLFYMPEQRDSGRYVSADDTVYIYDSSGILFYGANGDFWYHGTGWDSSGRQTYLEFPWNVITSAERGGGGASLIWDINSGTPGFEWSMDGPGNIIPLSQVSLHKPYPIEQVTVEHEQEYDYDYSVPASDAKAYIRPDGTLITEFKYQQAGTFSDGIAACMRNGYWGYIDENGSEITDFIYDAVWTTGIGTTGLAYPCTSDTMVVRKNGEWGVLYRDGTLLIAYGQFEDMAPAWNDQLWAKKDGKWGLIDLAAAKQKAGVVAK